MRNTVTWDFDKNCSIAQNLDKMLCFKFISKHTFGVIINVLWSPVSDGNVEI